VKVAGREALGDAKGAAKRNVDYYIERMMITVKCPSCGVTVRGQDRLAGKKVKCGKCQTIFRFPQLPATAGTQGGGPKTAPEAASPRAASVPRPSARPKSRAKTPSRGVRPGAAPKGGKKLVVLGSIGVGVIAGVVLLIVFVPQMFGGSSSAMIGQYASADTFVVASVDFQNIIKSDLYEKLGLGQLVQEGMTGAPTKLKPEDIARLVVLVDKPALGKRFRPAPTIVVRTMRDIPFKEMMDPRMAAMIKEHEGVEYVDLGRGALLTKTDTATVCMLSTGGVDAMKKIVSRLETGEVEELNESLRSAMVRVSGQASFVAMYIPDSMKDEIARGPDILSSIKGGGLGFSVDSDLKLKASAAFSKDEDAEAAVKMVEGFKAMGALTIKGMVSDADDDDVKSVLGALAKTLDGVKIGQDGSQLLAEASVAGGDIALVKDKFAKVMPVLMSGGTGTSGGKPAANPLSAIMGIFGK